MLNVQRVQGTQHLNKKELKRLNKIKCCCRCCHCLTPCAEMHNSSNVARHSSMPHFSAASAAAMQLLASNPKDPNSHNSKSATLVGPLFSTTHTNSQTALLFAITLFIVA